MYIYVFKYSRFLFDFLVLVPWLYLYLFLKCFSCFFVLSVVLSGAPRPFGVARARSIRALFIDFVSG